MKNKTVLFLLLATLVSMLGSATVPQRRMLYHTQSDSTTLKVYTYSDAFITIYSTADGYALVRSPKCGDFVYARQADGELQPTGMIAHDPATSVKLTGFTTFHGRRPAVIPGIRKKEELQFLEAQALTAEQLKEDLMGRLDGKCCTRAAANNTESSPDGIFPTGKVASGVVPSVGQTRIPIIMVEFPDRKFLTTTTQDLVERMYNEQGYTDGNGSAGSARDYFSDQSEGYFLPDFSVVARVQASKGYAYYGQNSSTTKDLHYQELVYEAVELASAAGADFKSFYNEKNAVPLVVVYFAGPGENSAYEQGSEDYMWPKFLRSSFIKAGCNFSSLFIGNEVMQDYYDEQGKVHFSDADQQYPVPQSSTTEGIGVFVHEMGHALGLPDLYYTGTNAALHDTLATLNYWSVMDYGQYWRDGYAPIGYSAQERNRLGWLQIEELTQPGMYTLAPLSATSSVFPRAYMVRAEANNSEYYILENRQESRWFPRQLGQGMLVSHIDYLSSAWTGNRVNNDPQRRRFTIICADNDDSNLKWNHEPQSSNEFKGDLYPGYTSKDVVFSNTELTDTSTPPASVYSGSGKMQKPILDIKQQADGNVTFTFISAPDAIASPTLTEEAASLQGEVYTLDGRRVSGNRLPTGIYIQRQGATAHKIIVK